jgi:GT2 family glycosyltransferase
VDLTKRRAKALIVTINYRGELATKAFLASLQRANGFSEIDVIIVDNASADDAISRLMQETVSLPNVKVLKSASNRGYFGGARWGMECYLAEEGMMPDWVIVCNNDVVIRDTRFFQKLFERDPDSAGVLAPRIESLATHLDQNPFLEERPDRKTLARLWFWGRCYPLAVLQHAASKGIRWLRARARRGTRGGAAGEQQTRRIYAAHGAFLIFSRQFFRCGGFLDDHYFLYGEELAVAEICRSVGLGVTYDPTLHVLHNEHQTTSRWLTRFAYDCQRNARRYLKERYLGDIA